jgi:predicted metal-binding membrane protein
MIKLQKIILVSLLSTAGLSWLLSTFQPDMMNIMNTYNPILISLFTASWTAGMAAMMFPAIVPMVLLYNKLVTNKQSESSKVITQPKFAHIFKVILFIGMYLVVWTLTGIGLLLVWSVPMNSLVRFHENNIFGLLFGGILIISGIYQFTPLKNKCIGYCESPLSFFMRRWKNGIVGAIKMGIYHGLYCLGCCWPYFLIMVALGWMNLAWMGLFAIIIFGEKIWTKGIWIARSVGIILIILGTLSSLGLIVLYDNMMVINNQNNTEDKMIMAEDRENASVSKDKSELGKKPVMPHDINM